MSYVERRHVKKGDIESDTIRLEIPIPLGFIPTGLAAGSLGGGCSPVLIIVAGVS